MGSEVFIATSTPSSWLSQVASKYGLSVVVNEGESGIGQDWNFAYSQATRFYVTIAHQDDFYCPNYVTRTLDYFRQSNFPLICFSDYGEIRNGSFVQNSRMLEIKRRMLAPLKMRTFSRSIFIRRRILSLGSPICCPSVTFCREAFPNPPFKTEMKCSLDWDTWETLSRKTGDFLYCPEILMYHRIHEDSATTKLIKENARAQEDLTLFCRFWPKPIARMLARRYSVSQKSNNLK